jgi:hypothetical protein
LAQPKLTARAGEDQANISLDRRKKSEYIRSCAFEVDLAVDLNVAPRPSARQILILILPGVAAAFWAGVFDFVFCFPGIASLRTGAFDFCF